ncbi:Uncharacterized conserved protein (COG2071) [Haladaptatus litoreus]|uniref:Uncharacterized conserved protein (COG2071) n=1 Tax=Haladaptatus litoreus TaxID=553468 RepID=A0A1N6WQA4_9EURY|nr:DUF2071 domain-containing protein [Haladaptatus litoreus]SIQ92240.1 Uncharacterized conserved protein (COG2071) [Haladaptatus litoreus]
MLPTVRGVIDRRILVNYRVEPEVVTDVLPDPFRPQTVDGYAIGGICLIRLQSERPNRVPACLGTTSENAAHRIAVEWNDDGERETGVFVPRRDTNSRFNTLLGGTLFAGDYHEARFDVDETAGQNEHDGRYEVRMVSDDKSVRVGVAGEPTDSLPTDSVFDSVAESSAFFEQGSLGYSPSAAAEGEYEGIELHAFNWEVTPLAVDSVTSSYFEAFPDDAVTFDHALLMEDIDHEWRERDPICTTSSA